MAKRSAARKKLEGGVEAFFEGGRARGYFFSVPEVFADQLDIARTSKGATQGTCFSFEEGDVFYDSAAPMAIPWGEAVKSAKFALMVDESVPSSIISEEDASGDGVKRKKYVLDGPLKFLLFRRRAGGGLDFSSPEIFESDQYAFARLLESGTLESGGETVFTLA